MPLVAGIDTSTQSCKVVVRDAETGELVRAGSALGTPTAPRLIRTSGGTALQVAIEAAGGIDDVAAIAVGGQQHGMVCLDESGEVVRPALLWNDTRSAQAAEELIADLGGGEAGQTRLGRGGRLGAGRVVHGDQAALARPARARQRRAGRGGLPAARLPDLAAERVDRHRASSSPTAATRAARRTGHLPRASIGSTCSSSPSVESSSVPRVLGPPSRPAGRPPARSSAREPATTRRPHSASAPQPAMSWCRSVRRASPVQSRETAPADAVRTGRGLRRRHRPVPPAGRHPECRPGARRGVPNSSASITTVWPALAMAAPAGADGLVLVPYLEGERTPNRPDATGALHGLRLATSTPAHLARAMVEGHAVRPGRRPRCVACAGRRGATPHPDRRRSALQRRTADRADGAGLAGHGAAESGSTSPTVPPGRPPGCCPVQPNRRSGRKREPSLFEAEPTPQVRDRYARVRDLTAPQV